MLQSGMALTKPCLNPRAPAAPVLSPPRCPPLRPLLCARSELPRTYPSPRTRLSCTTLHTPRQTEAVLQTKQLLRANGDVFPSPWIFLFLQRSSSTHLTPFSRGAFKDSPSYLKDPYGQRSNAQLSTTGHADASCLCRLAQRSYTACSHLLSPARCFHAHSRSSRLPPDTRPHARTLHWLRVSPSVHALLQTHIHSLVCKHPCLFAHSQRHPRARARTLTLVFHAICTLTLSTQPSRGRFLGMHLQGQRQCPPAWPDTSGRDFSQSIFPSPSPLPWSRGGCICAVSHA